ncbi:MAG: OmpA family protein, partial [Casimicrobium sp.]
PMKPTEHTNAALAILLFGGIIVTPSLAQSSGTADAGKPTPGASLFYHGADTRVGLGWDSELDARGEIFQVFQSSDTSATLGELWLAKRSGGVKLAHNWANGGKTAVNKAFAAFDVTDRDHRKFTLGGGQEYRSWFWNTYVSKGASGDQLLVDATSSRTGFTLGNDAGGDFRQDFGVSQNAKLFTRAFDWGVGARVGHFYSGPLLRLTAGIDYEWGKARSLRICNNAANVPGAAAQPPSCTSESGLGGKPTQLTGSILLEKFFEGSGFSVALSGEALRRKGQLVDDRSDTRGVLMLRYEFGAPKSNFRPSKLTKTVTTTERVPDPNWTPPPAPAPVAAAAVATPPAAPQFRTETKTSRFDTNDAQETYFDLGSAKLKPAAMKELDALVARINAQQPYVELRVRIVGHTCPTGSDRNNFPLSQKRADAVRDYLVSKGVPANVITTDAKAGKAPKYPEVKGQSFRNRRADTDVIIVKEKSEQVQVPVAAAPVAQAATPATPAAPAPERPMIDRQVSREVIEDQPDPWV